MNKFITSLKSNLRQAEAQLSSLHRRMATSEHARNWKNFAALAVIAAVVASFAQNEPAKTGTLKSPVTIPIVIDGKQVGSTTLPAGAKVTVGKEDPTTGKLLVKAAAGETWVEGNQVQLPTMDAPPTVSPQPMSETGGTPQEANTSSSIENNEETPTEPKEEKPKRVLVWGSILDKQSDMVAIQLLQEKGYEVVKKSPRGWMREGTGTEKKTVPTLRAEDLTQEAEEFPIVWVAAVEPTQESAEAIRKITNKKKIVIITGFTKVGAKAYAMGNAREAKESYDRTYRGQRKTSFGLEGNLIYTLAGSPIICPAPDHRERVEEEVKIAKELHKGKPKEEIDEIVKEIYSRAASKVNADAAIPDQDKLKQFYEGEFLERLTSHLEE